MKLIAKDFTTVGELTAALSKLPANAGITPFGDEDAALVYDNDEKVAYLDNITFFEENDMLPEDAEEETADEAQEDNDAWFLFISGENYMDVKRFSSYEAAHAYMSEDYENYAFNPSDYGNDGSCDISDTEAHVDSPEDGWQRCWMITSVNELNKRPVEK